MNLSSFDRFNLPVSFLCQLPPDLFAFPGGVGQELLDVCTCACGRADVFLLKPMDDILQFLSALLLASYF